MKTTYTGTLRYATSEKLQKANVTIEIHDVVKYECEEAVSEMNYTGLTSWDIISGGEEAEAIENIFGIMDDFHEYLVLHFNDGRVATFRNSYVVMFII